MFPYTEQRKRSIFQEEKEKEKILSVILAMILVLSLAACGGRGKTPGETGSDQAETIVLGDHTAVFKGYTLTKDEDGRDALCLTYDYTNGSKK